MLPGKIGILLAPKFVWKFSSGSIESKERLFCRETATRYTFQASQTVDLHRFVRAIDFFALGQGLENESLQAQSVAEMLDLNLGSCERLFWDTVPPLTLSDFSEVRSSQDSRRGDAVSTLPPTLFDN